MDTGILRERALDKLKGNWGTAIGTSLVLYLISALAGQFINVLTNYSSESLNISGLGGVIVYGPVTLGMSIVMLQLMRQRTIQFDNAFQGFRNFKNSFVLGFLVMVYTILWSMLLIIPGIIKWISYSQAFYIMADEPGIGANEAIERSQELMEGYKMAYFVLHLSFFGWAIACVFTLGIGFLWLYPWVEASKAAFYLELRGEEGWDLVDEFGVAEEL